MHSHALKLLLVLWVLTINSMCIMLDIVSFSLAILVIVWREKLMWMVGIVRTHLWVLDLEVWG